VRLTRQRFNGTSEPYAVVWSNRHDMATAQVTLNGTGQIGTTMKITFTDKYHPAGVYVAAASFSTLPQYLALPEGHLIPLGIDNLFLATASGAFPGFKGTLNGQGTGQASMPLPNLTIIRGIKVYLAVAVFRSGSGGKMVKGTSEAVSFTIM